MALRFDKCGQDSPHLGDSWCLGCSALEALGGELRSGWGSPGTRSLATDLITSAVRQVRALRRLGIAGAGRIRARTPDPAGTPHARSEAARSAPELRPAEGDHLPKSEQARDPTPAAGGVKDEPPGEESEYEEYTDEEDSPEEELGGAGLKPAPQARSERADRSEIPRRRVSGQSAEDRSAGRSRVGHSRSPRSSRRSRAAEHERDEEKDHRDRRDHHRRSRDRRGERRGDQPKRKRRRKWHRGGSKLPRVYRAHQDPFKRFHHKKPAEFWDRGLNDF